MLVDMESLAAKSCQSLEMGLECRLSLKRIADVRRSDTC